MPLVAGKISDAGRAGTENIAEESNADVAMEMVDAFGALWEVARGRSGSVTA